MMDCFSVDGKLTGTKMQRVVCGLLLLHVLFVCGCSPRTGQSEKKAVQVEANSSESEVPTGTQSTTKNAAVNQNTTGRFRLSGQVTELRRFVYSNDEDHSNYSIVESMGGGVAISDYDRDGNLDVFCAGGGTFGEKSLQGNKSGLFRNLGEWQFIDVSSLTGAAESRHFSHGFAAADLDEDGFDDFVVTGYGGLTLYHNQGDGRFVEITPSSGLDDRLWSTSAAWGDFNGDRILDLYVAHYVDWSFSNDPICNGVPPHDREVCPPRRYGPLPDIIYFGVGDGSFNDATNVAGLRCDGKGIGVVAGDIDLDSDLDIYVANDTVANFLYRNDGQGKLEDISLESGTSVSERGLPEGSMGTDISDLTLDGKPDIWVTNYERESCGLYRNLGTGLFRHVSQSTGITAVGAVYVGWGTRAIDLDCDGDEDLFVSNGHVLRHPADSQRRQKPIVFENLDGKRFVNVAEEAGEYTSTPHCGRGVATGDLDGDGDEDIVVSNLNEPVEVLSSDGASLGNWVSLRAIGRESCRSGIGTFAIASIGDVKRLRQIRGGSSYASSSDTRLHFGCGESRQIDELVITFPSKRTVRLLNVPCNRELVVVEPLAD